MRKLPQNDRYECKDLVEVTEHENYKTCRIKTEEGRILKFNIFPDYSYSDLAIKKEPGILGRLSQGEGNK